MSFAPVHTSVLHAMPSNDGGKSDFMALADYGPRKLGLSGVKAAVGLSQVEKHRLMKSKAIVSIAPPLPPNYRKVDVVRAARLNITTSERDERIVKLHKKGLIDREISAAIGWSAGTVGEVILRLVGRRERKVNVERSRKELDAIKAQKRPSEKMHACARRLGLLNRYAHLRRLETKGPI